MRKRIVVLGVGNLGYPLAQLLAEAGHEVFGYDVNDVRMPPLVRRIEPPFPELDVAFIAVPTPSRPDGFYSLEHVMNALGQLEVGPVIGIVSTVHPGSCALMAHLSELPPLIYCPQFIRLGHVRDDMRDPDFVLIGADHKESGDVIEEVLRSVIYQGETWKGGQSVPFVRLSVLEAELTKLAVNTFVTTKISYANMIGEIAGKIGADAEKICRAIGLDRRIGHAYLRPGGAYRGPCFPRDNKALAAVARALGLTADLAEATDTINERQPNFFPEDEESGRGY